MRADIHDGPEHMLQSEAGYIDARPLTPARQNLLQRTAGPYIRVKLRKTQCEQMSSGLLQKADIARYSRHVANVPEAEVEQSSLWAIIVRICVQSALPVRSVPVRSAMLCGLVRRPRKPTKPGAASPVRCPHRKSDKFAISVMCQATYVSRVTRVREQCSATKPSPFASPRSTGKATPTTTP